MFQVNVPQDLSALMAMILDLQKTIAMLTARTFEETK